MNSLIFQNQSNTNNAIILNAVFLIAILLFLEIANPMAIVFAYIFETIIIGLIHGREIILRY